MPPDPQTPSDEELARQTQAGSMPAFEKLVCRYEGRIYRFVAQFCPVDADVQEIVQETFVRAYRAIGQFDARKTFAPWLFTIARRKSVDHYRTAPPVTDGELPEQPSPDDPAESLARRDERQNLWRVARRRLPDAQFQALWLRYAEDMLIVDIARTLHKTQTHVKVLLFRARRSLGRELEAEKKGCHENLVGQVQDFRCAG